MKRATRKEIRMFCLNDPADAEAYSNLMNDPRVTLFNLTDNWDNFGNWRLVATIERDVDERPMPQEDIDLDEEFA